MVNGVATDINAVFSLLVDILSLMVMVVQKVSIIKVHFFD